MPAATSLYRKYRSQTFDELVGQEPVVRTLKNAIANGLIAQAYLFTGPRGVGKTSAARLLARAANCLSGGPDKPCNECANCVAAVRDIATDLIEIDAASNTGVDNIREVIEKAQFSPSVWHTKFYIIDEVHMLSVSAFNALLKTLEEPPPHTSFILATTEVHKVPQTVASRCQRFDFRRIPLSAMIDRLEYICGQEGIEAEQPALELVARQATGSLRDAESLLDQLRVYSEGGITLASVQDLLGASGSERVAGFVDTVIAADLAEGLRAINSVQEDGLDLRQFNRQVVEHLRALMLVKSGAASGGVALLDVTEEMKSRLAAQSERVSMSSLLRWVKAFADADANLRATSYRQLPMEMALVEAVLQVETTTSVPASKDRSAELGAGVEPIGAMPGAKSSSSSEGNGRGHYSPAPPPPPIHSQLESIAKAEVATTQPSTGAELSANEETTQPSRSTPDEQLERLLKLWPQVLDQINARSRAMAAVFRDPQQVRPASVVGSVCTIAFRDQIHVTRSQMATQRNVIETALSRVLGYSCRLESVSFADAQQLLGSDDSGPEIPDKPNGNATREKPSPYETTRGKAAMNIFGITKFDDTP